MASLYRKPIILNDPISGEKIKTKSKKWWGQFKDANGKLKRVPLAVDKNAAQAMLNKLVKRVELEKAGLVDPTEEQRKQPLAVHIQQFESSLRNKGVSEKHVGGTVVMIRKMANAKKWKFIADISASSTLEFLGQLRRNGFGIQTYNNYLTAIKHFTRWLVRDRRTPTDPLLHLSRLNVRTDRRHDRRTLSADEFARLVDAARNGKRIENIFGTDRAMMYILAAWTGFRRGEIGSLTMRSFRLDDEPPTATVDACYSKRRRQDVQVLHPEVVHQLKDWLSTKKEFKPDTLLFPVSANVPGGKQRKTSKMLQRDLSAARKKWLEEAKTEEEIELRQNSDFLCYINHAGLFADFHSFRHWFITGLARAGVSPKMAQTLARHSDIRLTLGVYTHVELHDQTAAIAALPMPPSSVAPVLKVRKELLTA